MLREAGYTPQTQDYYGDFYDEYTFLRAVGKKDDVEINCYFTINGHLAAVELNDDGTASEVRETSLDEEAFNQKFQVQPDPLFVKTTKAELEAVYIGKPISDY